MENVTKLMSAPFMYMLAEIIVRTCINIRNAFKEYKEGGKES